MKINNLFGIFIRYIILVLLALGNLYLFYQIFTPLTIYPSLWVLKLFYNAYIQGNILTANNIQISLIQACIAGAAYYLLCILNLTTPIPLKTRIKSLCFLLFSFLILNILRIVVFTTLFINNYRYFNFTHELFWYFGSTILVLFIWFVNTMFFKIKEIPIYSDFKDIIKLLREKHK